MQNEPQHIEPSLNNYSGGKQSSRCKAIYGAYTDHVISLKDMTYALMQYYIAEIAGGNMHNHHPLPPNPVKPEKGASVEILDKYYRDHASYRRADNQNYETTEMIKRVEEFQLALKDDDYDYSKAKEWATYIVTGAISGAVKAYLDGKQPTPAAEVEADNECDIPF